MKAHWKNPWPEAVIVPIEELAKAFEPYNYAMRVALLQKWQTYGDKLDAYILPAGPSGIISVGIRYGDKPDQYLSPIYNQRRTYAIDDLFREYSRLDVCTNSTQKEKRMQVIGVKFKNSWNDKVYAYKAPGDVVIAVGDHVVVDSPMDGYTCVKVVSVDEIQATKATKEIICRVNDDHIQARKKAEEERKKILAELKKIDTKHREKIQFAYLAAHDPEAAQLLKRLEELQTA